MVINKMEPLVKTTGELRDMDVSVSLVITILHSVLLMTIMLMIVGHINDFCCSFLHMSNDLGSTILLWLCIFSFFV